MTCTVQGAYEKVDKLAEVVERLISRLESADSSEEGSIGLEHSHTLFDDADLRDLKAIRKLLEDV